MADDIIIRLRRSDPAQLEAVTKGRRAELAELLDAIHAALRDLAEVITDTQLALPGDIQPLWGPDERRVMTA
jgi:uncharacterized alpha-E superfamily protein